MRKTLPLDRNLNVLTKLKTFTTLHQEAEEQKMIKKEKLQETARKLTADKQNFISALRRNLYLYLENKEITLNSLSEASDMNPSTLKTFLYGNAKDISLSNVVKLAKALGVSIDELVGADTIPELSRESLRMCREMPENDLMLVRWFIRCLYDLNSQNEPNKRYVKVMLPEEDNNGNCKLVSKFENVEITDLEEPLRSKIFMGFKVISDYYMPYYMTGNTVLIANDRPAKTSEHVLVRVGDYFFIVKRKTENGVAKLYSIRDDKYRIDEADTDEIVGYITHTIKN